MSDKCTGCDSMGKTPHSTEFLFQHFLCYTSYSSQSDNVIAMLKKAYFDGCEPMNS
jgi:hypothetical protein